MHDELTEPAVLFFSMSFPRTFEEWQENVLLAAADLLVGGAQLR